MPPKYFTPFVLCIIKNHEKFTPPNYPLYIHTGWTCQPFFFIVMGNNKSLFLDTFWISTHSLYLLSWIVNNKHGSIHLVSHLTVNTRLSCQLACLVFKQNTERKKGITTTIMHVHINVCCMWDNSYMHVHINMHVLHVGYKSCVHVLRVGYKSSACRMKSCVILGLQTFNCSMNTRKVSCWLESCSFYFRR